MIQASSPTLENGIIRIHSFADSEKDEFEKIVILHAQLFPEDGITNLNQELIRCLYTRIANDPCSILLYDTVGKGLAIGTTDLRFSLDFLNFPVFWGLWRSQAIALVKKPSLAIDRLRWIFQLPRAQCGYIRFLDVQKSTHQDSFKRKYALISTMEREMKLAKCMECWMELPHRQVEDVEIFLRREFQLILRGKSTYLLRKIFYGGEGSKN